MSKPLADTAQQSETPAHAPLSAPPRTGPPCCSTAVKATCCEPNAKASCCGAREASTGSCGCKP